MSLHRRATEHTSRFAGRDALTANELLRHDRAPLDSDRETRSSATVAAIHMKPRASSGSVGSSFGWNSAGPAPSDSRRALAGRGRRAFDRKSAVTGKDVAATSQAAVDVAQSALDLELLYRGNVEPDRFHLHTQQLRVHAAAKDLAGMAGEVAVLEWIRDRLAPSLSEPQLADLNTELRALRGASSARNASAAAELAARAAAKLRGG